jgi:hypothetical protein
MSRKSRLFNVMAGATASAAARGARRARSGLRDILGGGRFTCACCPDRVFRGHKALNAHHLARHGGYWGGKAGRAMARKVGKDVDAARRHARGWLEAHGHVDRLGRRTGRARSRPQAPARGHLSLRQMRQMARHGRDHDEADRHDLRAARAAARGNRARQVDHHHQAARLRNLWPARPPRVSPAPARLQPARRAPSPTPPAGRLAPAPNGTRTAPQRAGRTRA